MEIVREQLKCIEENIAASQTEAEESALDEARIELLQAMFAVCGMSEQEKGRA